jgi:hypothetical protein
MVNIPIATKDSEVQTKFNKYSKRKARHMLLNLFAGHKKSVLLENKHVVTGSSQM